VVSKISKLILTAWIL